MRWIVIEAHQRPLDSIPSEDANGELLARRLAQGPIPPEDALRQAILIGCALRALHVRGIAHGALCPSSIAIGPAGVRILRSTITIADSAPYRAPEQVRGKAADLRSDLFAYGAILYEIATGRRAFYGTGDDLARRILQEGPPAPEEPVPAYHAMAGVITSCLEKRPEVRRQRIQNAVAELKLVRQSLPIRKPPAGQKRGHERNWLRGWLVVITIVAAGAIGLAAMLLLEPRPSPSVYAFRLEAGGQIAAAGAPAISPDGAHVTFVAAGADGRPALWLRRLSNPRSEPVAGTEGASSPFWSRDSRYIGFFANRDLKKIPLAGGEPETICTAESAAGGATWSGDGTILFAPGLNGGLYRVAGSPNSRPESVLEPDPSKSELGFRWPQFLPDQKHFLFFAKTDSAQTTGIAVGVLGSTRYQRLFGSETNAVFSPIAGRESGTGYLLYMRGRALLARPFDTSRLAPMGDAFAVAEDVGAVASVGLAPLSVSQNSALVYQTVGRPTRQLVWVDRGGEPVAVVKVAGEWGDPRVSPDGNRALAAKLKPDGERANIWLVDVSGDAAALTAGAAHQGSPVWAPDGTRFGFFQQGRSAENFELYAQGLSASSSPQLLVNSDSPKYPTDWSRDGRYLLFTTLNPGSSSDIWVLSFAEKRAGPVLGTVANEGFGALSPDRQWLAFQSDTSGQVEVYVQRFEGIEWAARRQWQVSTGGGGRPRWRADGKELYYFTPQGRLMAATVHTGAGGFAFEPPHALFQTHTLPKTWNLYDVSPDGRRFLLNLPLELANSASIGVLTNWTRKLEQAESGERLPAKRPNGPLDDQ